MLAGSGGFGRGLALAAGSGGAPGFGGVAGLTGLVAAGALRFAQRVATIMSSPPLSLDSPTARGKRQGCQASSPLRRVMRRVSQWTATEARAGGSPHSTPVERTPPSLSRQDPQS